MNKILIIIFLFLCINTYAQDSSWVFNHDSCVCIIDSNEIKWEGYVGLITPEDDTVYSYSPLLEEIRSDSTFGIIGWKIIDLAKNDTAEWINPLVGDILNPARDQETMSILISYESWFHNCYEKACDLHTEDGPCRCNDCKFNENYNFVKSDTTSTFLINGQPK